MSLPVQRGGEKAFPTREELLAGLPARRASTLLFAIESRTAQLMARSRRAMATHHTERTAAEQERAFLAALAEGREGRTAPRVQDLERHADGWRDLVPADPALRAALARLVLRKYPVPIDARALQAALGLADPAVASAYQRGHGEPPEAGLARRVSVRERLRWLSSRFAARLERMPPFWAAYALTLTETVGGGILALPIALAGFGIAGAIGLLVVFGIVNVITVAALCEAITRDGPMRYGSTYFGRLVGHFLGRPGLVTQSVALTIQKGIVLTVGLTGFGFVLGNATGLHPAIWAAGLFAVTLLVLGRGSLDATVASAIVIGSVNLALLGIMAVLAFAAGGGGTSPSGSEPGGVLAAAPATVGVAFGVLLSAYFGHVSAGNVAKIVLSREPTGRALLWGNVAAMLTVTAVYCVVLTAIFGAVDEQVLVGYPGTVIAPLAEAVGPAVHVLGAAYVSLALGIGSLYGALGLFNIGGEALDSLRGRGQRWLAGLASPRARFVLQATPALGVFVLVEALLLLDRATFTGPLGLAGTLVTPILAGVFPILVLAAARLRGDRVPRTVLAVMGNRWVGLAIWSLYVLGVLAHVLIWDEPLARIAAGLVALLIVAITLSVLRRGSLRPAASLEVRVEDSLAGAADVSLVVRGRAHPVAAVEAGTRITVALPPLDVHELRIWAHRVTADGSSEALATQARVQAADEDEGTTLTLGRGGEALVRLSRQPVSVSFDLSAPAGAPGRAGQPRP